MSSFCSLFRVLALLLPVVAVALSLWPNAVEAQIRGGSLCFITYSSSGDIDYPWSVSVLLRFEYNSTVQHNANGSYYAIGAGGSSARYLYTNKSGTVALSSVVGTILNTGAKVYLNSTVPVDSTGIHISVASPLGAVQLPGVGPRQLVSQVGLFNGTAGATYGSYVQVGPAFSLDQLGQAWVSATIPGFVNRTIGASDRNTNSANYESCMGVINFLNGQRSTITPTPNNSQPHFDYNYTISDGATYSVTTNLTITTSSTPLIHVDELGNQYQNITAIKGTRVYTYLGRGGGTVTSTVTGLSGLSGTPSQRWYPFALLQSTPGVYNMNTGPFLDGDGIGFTIDPPAPYDGNAPGVFPAVSSVTVALVPPNVVSVAVLTELSYISAPIYSAQRQTYKLLP